MLVVGTRNTISRTHALAKGSTGCPGGEITDQQIKQTVINNLVSDYETIYNKMTFISDVEARVRAANGIMIYLSHVNDYGASVLPSSEPTATVPSTVDKGTTPLQAAPSSTPQPKRIDTPPYDAEKKRWNYCEVHPDEEIKHTSEKTGRWYYACLRCQEFLQSNGTRKKMGGKE